MKNNGTRIASGEKKGRLPQRLLSLLMAAVLLTSSFVHLPVIANAQVQQASCGYAAHTHTDECYTDTLVCGQEEQEGHTHTDECYAEQRELTCGLEEGEEHTHTDECYTVSRVLTCQLEETEGHTHTDDCYVSKLSCGEEEHTHTAACYSDAEADVETEAQWEQSARIYVTGNWTRDLAAVADTQQGYRESGENYTFIHDMKHGYTRYGAWAGDPYADWNTLFVAFCLHYAHIPASAMPTGEDAQTWLGEVRANESYASASDYTPRRGDVVFFCGTGDAGKSEEEKTAARVGIVMGVSGGKLSVAEGVSGAVSANEYALSDKKIIGYAVMPENPDYVAPTYVEATPATCETNGFAAHYVTADGTTFADADCFQRLTEAEAVIPAAHAWGEVSYTWAEDHSAVTALHVCGVCGETETETVAASGEVTKEATAEAKGETTYTSEPFANSAFEIQTITVEDIDALQRGETEPVEPAEPAEPTEPAAENGVMTYLFAGKNRSVSLLQVLRENGVRGLAVRSASVAEGSDQRAVTLRRTLGDFIVHPNGYFDTVKLDVVMLGGAHHTVVLSCPAPEVKEQDFQVKVKGSDTGVHLSGELPVGVLVAAEPAPVRQELPSEGQVLMAYDISLSLDNEELQPGSPVNVTLTAPAIARALEQGYDIVVYHIADDGTTSQVDCTADGNTVRFAAESFSVYAVVRTVKVFTITARDGATYEMTVAYDNTSGIPESAELAVRELAPGTEEYDSYVQQAADKLGTVPESFTISRAFDISLVDAGSGVHYQPNNKVRVTIKLLNDTITAENRVSVVHFVEDRLAGETGAEKLDCSVSGDAVEFATKSFSVYVVSEDQRGYIYKFMSPEGSEYTQLRQTLYDGDNLVRPVSPSDSGRVFVKWTWNGIEGTDATSDFTGWGPVSVPTNQRGMKTIAINAVFVDNAAQYRVIYHDQSGNVFRQDTYAAGADIDPNGLSNAANRVDYTVIQPDSAHYLTFGYWTEDIYELDNSGKPLQFAATTISDDVNLYPYCPEAHWLHFDANRKAVNNASVAFTPSLVILEGEVPEHVTHPTVTGYTFAGWYLKPAGNEQIFDANGDRVAATDGAWDWAFEQYLYTGGDSLDSDRTLYAHWTPATTAEYTVAYYVQDPAQAVGLSDAEKEYILQKIVGTRSGTVGENAVVTAADNVTNLIAGSDLEAAGLVRNDVRTVPVKIQADGSAILAVYFDRLPFTMTFWAQKTGGSQYTEKTVTQLYGHDMTDHRDGKGWPYNKKSPQTLQWVDRDDTSVTSNKILTLTMPAENHNYYDGASTGNSYTRRFYMESVDSTATAHSDYSGYVLDTGKYMDTRTSSGGQSNMQIYANAVDETPIPGFTLVRIDGASSATTAINKQWVIAEDYHTLTNYTTDRTNSSSSTGGLMRYYGRNNQYYADLYYQRHSNDLTLHVILNGVEVDSQLYAATKFDKPLEALAEAYRAGLTYENIKKLSGSDYWWYYDDHCTVAVKDLSNLNMPDREYHLYLGLRTAYEVNMNPQGGQMDGVAASTYFNVGVDEAVSEAVITRDYVLWSELYGSKSELPAGTKLFSYVYNTRSVNDGTRSAKYVELDNDGYDAFNGGTTLDDRTYVYYPGLWLFQYWYEDGHEDTSFDFKNPPNRPLDLSAKWTRAGSYTVVYNADCGGKSYHVPVDERSYLESSKAIIKASVDQPGDKQFRFWYTEAQNGRDIGAVAESQRFYPNQSLTVSADYTPGQLDKTERTITLYAWYEDGTFTPDGFADYEFYLPVVSGGTTTWTDGQGGAENVPYYVQTISPGETLIMPVLPTGAEAPEGTFVGWFTEPAFEHRFDGFGEISAPINTKLYARYAEICTVTYKEPNDGRTITVQTYIKGDVLNTLSVEFTTTNDQYVQYWTDGVYQYTYQGKGVVPGTTTDTDAGKVMDDMTLTPVIGDIYMLSFDARGGSYVDPITMPQDTRRWVAEPLSTKRGFDLVGWFTEPEGGVQYAFNGPLTAWASANGVDLSENNPLKLYAHWVSNGEEIKAPVTVNYWVQNTSRSGYFLWATEAVGEQTVGSTYTLTAAQRSTDKLAGYETFPDGNDATDDRDYFELGSYTSTASDDFVSFATETSAEVKEEGAELNVYFNRKTFTLIFSPDRTYTETERVAYRNRFFSTNYQDVSVTYTVNGSVHSEDPYTFTAWLGMEADSVWPVYGAGDYTTTHPNISIQGGYTAYPVSDWENTYYFSGWTEYSGTEIDADTRNAQFENVVSAQSTISKKLLPSASQDQYTFRAEYVADSDPEANKVTVHYYTVDAMNEVHEMVDYEQVVYGVTGSGSGANWAPSAAEWTKIEAAATQINGYVYNQSRRDSEKLSGTIQLPYYNYSMPDDYDYCHRLSFGRATFPDLFLTNNTNVKPGQFKINYTYLGLTSHTHEERDVVYLFPAGSQYVLGRSVRTSVGTISTAELRNRIEATRVESGNYYTVTQTGNHVYLYYEAAENTLTLHSAESTAWTASREVKYGTALTNETATFGYLNEGANKVTPPSVPGKTFAYWSLAEDSTTPFEGAMPDHVFDLWAHYVDTQVTVTTVGVTAFGALQRDTDPAKTILRDGNDVPQTWGEDDYDAQRVYGTRLQEFELPTPALETGEIFYGWKRVENGKMMGSYMSNNTAVVTDTVVAPHIVVNAGGAVAYFANNGGTFASEYDRTDFLYDESGYYFGATARAKAGTETGIIGDAALQKDSFAFVCWNTAEDGGGTSYYPGDAVPLPDEGALKLYAQYESKREITLIYHLHLPVGLDQAAIDAAEFVALDEGAELVGLETVDGETVLRIKFPDYLEDSRRYPNSEYPAAADSEGTRFTVFCPGKTFLHWNNKPDDSGEVSLRTDDMRVNTLYADANNELHLYAQWTDIVLPVQVWETTPQNLEDQYRLRAVTNKSTHPHKGTDGVITDVDTSTWTDDPVGKEFHSYLKSVVERSESAKVTAIEWYFADVRHGVDMEDSYLKSVLSSNEEIEIKWVRFNATDNVWQYASADTKPDNSSGDWHDFDAKSGDELKIYYERPQFMVFFDYNGGLDEESGTYSGRSADAAFIGVTGTSSSVEVPASGITRNGYKLVGWSIEGRRADLDKNAELPTDNNFFALDDTVPLVKTGSGETLGYLAGRSIATRVSLYKSYDDTIHNPKSFDPASAPLYAVWQVAPWVCKITDATANETLLYYNAGTSESPVYKEAVFTQLEGFNGAFANLGNLYVKNGGDYAAFTGATKVQMLVENYELGGTATLGAYTTTLTTASKTPVDPADTHPYAPDDESSTTATISAGKSLKRARMFCVDGANADVTVTDLVVDAARPQVNSQNVTCNQEGAIFCLKGSHSALTLAEGAVLRNSVSEAHGGAVDLFATGTSLTMTDDATIQNCTAPSGAAVYMHTHTSFTMAGGVITGNRGGSANGGAANVAGSSCTVSFGGNARVIDNPDGSEGTQQKNVVLEHDSNSIIRTTDAGLGADAVIGVYVAGEDTGAESTVYDKHGDEGDPFGTFYNSAAGKANLEKFINDRNGLHGGEGDADQQIVWKPNVKVCSGVTFGEFDNEDDPKISQDSAYTIRLNANKTDSLVFAREKSNGDLEPVSLPAGTTIILRVMDDGELKLYHYELTSAASSIPLSSFTRLGGGSTPLDSSFTGQFIVDFSHTAGGMTEGKLITGMAPSGSTKPSASGAVTLVGKASFTLTKDAADTTDEDLVATVNVTTNAGSTVNEGRATIWDNREMALVIENSGANALPPDAALKVRIGGVETTYTPSAAGKYIIPLGELKDYSGIQITLDSAYFPRSASGTAYELAAKLMVSNSEAEGSPLNGWYNGAAGTPAASATLKLKAPARQQPSIKITTASKAYEPGSQVAISVANLHIPDSAEVMLTVYKKGATWDGKTSKATATLKASGVAATTPWSYTFTTDAGTYDSYQVVVTVTDGGDTLMEVPYYFLAVKTN